MILLYIVIYSVSYDIFYNMAALITCYRIGKCGLTPRAAPGLRLPIM
jgi:hypothetical protein